MFKQFLLRLLAPEGKLPATFPWSVQTAGKRYFVALGHFMVGSFAVPLIVMGAIMILAKAPYSQLTEWVFGMIAEPNGQPKMSFVMGLSFVSFVMGFGMQLRYIAGQMRKEGILFREAMALTLKPLTGSWWGATLFKLLFPVAIAYGVTQLIGLSVVNLLGPAQQSTVDLARQATGGNFLLFALMAVVGAPIFEELVFRGFLYQVIRSSLRRGLQPLVLVSVPEKGFRRMLAVCGNWRRRSMHAFAERFYGVFGGGRAELSAIVLSSLMFSLMHMQFNPTTLVLLFALGCVQAEIYRRSGSLYCAILLHALNNGIDVLKLALGQA